MANPQEDWLPRLYPPADDIQDVQTHWGILPRWKARALAIARNSRTHQAHQFRNGAQVPKPQAEISRTRTRRLSRARGTGVVSLRHVLGRSRPDRALRGDGSGVHLSGDGGAGGGAAVRANALSEGERLKGTGGHGTVSAWLYILSLQWVTRQGQHYFSTLLRSLR